MAEGYHDFVAAEILTAANLEDYCELQGIMRFASAAARDTALASVLIEGLCAYLKDVNTITVYSGAAWSTIGPVNSALTSWTPAVTQAVNVTVTVNVATYSRVGRTIHAACVLSVTGAGTASSLITVTIPIAAAATWTGDYLAVGTGVINDNSDTVTGMRFAAVMLASTTTAKFLHVGVGQATANAPVPFMGATPSTTFGLAAADIISFNITYEAGADS